jgi:hypothetical protein
VDPRRLKQTIVTLLVLFFAVFLVGFVSGVPNLFLVPLAAYCGFGVVLVTQTLRSTPSESARAWLFLAGYSSIGFALAVSYGVLGIWGLYAIYDPLFVGGVILSASAFLVGATRGLLILRRA